MGLLEESSKRKSNKKSNAWSFETVSLWNCLDLEKDQ